MNHACIGNGRGLGLPRIVAAGCIVLFVTWVSSARGETPGLRAAVYHGIRPIDPGGRNGLRNPQRGLRIETLIAEPPGASTWGPAFHLKGKVSPGYSDDWWIRDALRYESHGLTLAQTYCYLDEFVDKPISERKLAWLQGSFDRLRENGLEAVLRFAYERNTEGKRGPTLDTILHHIDQLGPVVRRNADVIYVMQAGFVGAWGEWHSSTHGLEKDHTALAAIVAKVLEVLPADRMTQVRVPKYKRWVLSEPAFGGHRLVDGRSAFTPDAAARIGFNNDGFLAGKTCGGTWTEPPHYSNPGNPEFDTMTEECPYLPVDGELFWSDQGGKVGGLRAAVRMRLHHYSSFSLAHSYSERQGKPYSIDDWMKTELALGQIREANLPVSDGYFEDAQGRPMTRTEFEYIRDHLGYRIELLKAVYPERVKVNGPLTVEIELVNRGFSVMHDPRPVYLILIDEEGAATEIEVKNGDPRRWQPHEPGDADYKPLIHRFAIEHRLGADLAPGIHQLALWMPDAHRRLRADPRYAVRVANRQVAWWTDKTGRYGANVLGQVQVEP